MLAGVGGLLLAIVAFGLEGGSFLFTPFAGALLIGGFAVAVDLRVGAAQESMRVESDEIADVAAVLLARNPAALASVCDHLAHVPSRVRRTSWRADHLWFTPLPAEKVSDGDDDPVWSLRFWRSLAPDRSASDSTGEVAALTARATAAYQAAGLAAPPAPSLDHPR